MLHCRLESEVNTVLSSHESLCTDFEEIRRSIEMCPDLGRESETVQCCTLLLVGRTFPVQVCEVFWS